jgi:hypothetical protein
MWATEESAGRVISPVEIDRAPLGDDVLGSGGPGIPRLPRRGRQEAADYGWPLSARKIALFLFPSALQDILLRYFFLTAILFRLFVLPQLQARICVAARTAEISQPDWPFIILQTTGGTYFSTNSQFTGVAFV